MSFDDIPENQRETNACPQCEHGSVYEIDDGVWECDSCEWEHHASNSKNNQAGYIY